MSRLHAFLFLLRACAVLANTEKAIFLGPESLQVPTAHPTLEDLQLEVLSPQRLSLRTHIAAEFPTNDTKYGQSSWLLLQDLQEGQRYEVRVCWAATVRSPACQRLKLTDGIGPNFIPPRYIHSDKRVRESGAHHIAGGLF